MSFLADGPGAETLLPVLADGAHGEPMSHAPWDFTCAERPVAEQRAELVGDTRALVSHDVSTTVERERLQRPA